VEAPVRMKSEQLKLVDAASLLRPLCQVPRIALSESGALYKCSWTAQKRFLRMVGNGGGRGRALGVLGADVVVD
jgi:hypothetical protein